jgi:predicted metal-dependent hydrolase
VPDLLREGIILFNSGRYFEAHEVWEDLWRETRGPLRLFYQGLVHAAVGLHHLGRGNLNGARAQLLKSVSKLEQYPEWFCRIHNRKLEGDLREAMDSLVQKRIVIEQSA